MIVSVCEAGTRDTLNFSVYRGDVKSDGYVLCSMIK